MPETSNQNKNLIDLRELVNLINDRFDNVDQTYQELVEFLAEQFDKINAKIDTKADKADTATKEDIRLVLNRMAMINTKADDYRTEQISMQKQLDKHEKWHFQVAEKVGVKLSSDSSD